jgi:predicted RNase H-like nuclease
VRYVGVDLAWGQAGVTGLAALDASGRLLDVTRRRTDRELYDWLAPHLEGPCLVAFDAPLIVPNATGQRACERLIARHFGRFHAYCHTSNRGNPAFADGGRAERLSRTLRLDSDPCSPAERRAIEVYPHPAIVALFGLPRILRYKAKPGRDLTSLRAELLRLLDLLDGLAGQPVRLDAAAAPQWAVIRAAVEQARTKAALKAVEDAVDAVVCAYIARYAVCAPEAVRVFGTAAEGYILTPVTPGIAAGVRCVTDG